MKDPATPASDVTLQCDFVPSGVVITLEEPLPDIHSEWLVWYYCGLYKNTRVIAQPNVLIAFRRRTGLNTFSGDFYFKRLPVTVLGHFRIGSIWQGQVCIGRAIFETRPFHDLSYADGRWNYVSFNDLSERPHSRRHSAPYPQDIYPLQYPKDKNYLVEFSLENGGCLLVPCLEYFWRTYGVSQEFKRILMTYEWVDGEGSENNRLYGEPPEETDSRGRAVTIRNALKTRDAIPLWYAKYSPWTNRVLRSIEVDLEAQHDVESITPAFLKIGPWFKGKAELKVKGLPFDDGRSFLALEVVGRSYPEKMPLIVYRRQNENEVGAPADDDSPVAFMGVPTSVQADDPDSVPVTSGMPPDHRGAKRVVDDPVLELMGSEPQMKKVINEKGSYRSGPRNKELPTDKFAPGGEAEGRGKGVGKVSSNTTEIRETQGRIRDMWLACQYLCEHEPEFVESLESFLIGSGYSDANEPRLNSMVSPGSESASVTKDEAVKAWAYLDRATGKPRGLLVMRLRAGGRSVHILEIQPKRSRKKKDDDDKSSRPESFRGMVFILEDDTTLEKWLQKIIPCIILKRGQLAKLHKSVEGRSDVFKHKPSRFSQSTDEDDDSPEEQGAVPLAVSMIRLALSKVGVVRSASSGRSSQASQRGAGTTGTTDSTRERRSEMPTT